MHWLIVLCIVLLAIAGHQAHHFFRVLDFIIPCMLTMFAHSVWSSTVTRKEKPTQLIRIDITIVV